MSKKPTLNQLAPDFEAKPVFGKRLLLQKEAQTRPLVLVFVPGLASPVARNHLASLQSRVADFDLAGVGLYALTPSTLVSAQDFVPRHHLLFPLIADPERSIHRLYGAGRMGPRQALRSLQPESLKQGAAALRQGAGLGVRGTLRGARGFVVGRGGLLLHTYCAPSLFEPLPIDELLAVAKS